MGDVTDHPDFETFELDDTNDHLDPIADAIRAAIRDECDVPEDATIIPYTIDADASHEADSPGPAGKFDVGAVVVEE
jgi:hypothetical protein